MYKKNEIDIKVTVDRLNNNSDLDSREFIFIYEVCIVNNTPLVWDILDIRSKTKGLFNHSSKSKSINTSHNDDKIKPYSKYVLRRTVALKETLGKIQVEAIISNNVHGCKVLCSERSLVALSVVN